MIFLVVLYSSRKSFWDSVFPVFLFPFTKNDLSFPEFWYQPALGVVF